MATHKRVFLLDGSEDADDSVCMWLFLPEIENANIACRVTGTGQSIPKHNR